MLVIKISVISSAFSLHKISSPIRVWYLCCTHFMLIYLNIIHFKIVGDTTCILGIIETNRWMINRYTCSIERNPFKVFINLDYKKIIMNNNQIIAVFLGRQTGKIVRLWEQEELLLWLWIVKSFVIKHMKAYYYNHATMPHIKNNGVVASCWTICSSRSSEVYSNSSKTYWKKNFFGQHPKK